MTPDEIGKPVTKGNELTFDDSRITVDRYDGGAMMLKCMSLRHGSYVNMLTADQAAALTMLMVSEDKRE